MGGGDEVHLGGEVARIAGERFEDLGGAFHFGQGFAPIAKRRCAKVPSDVTDAEIAEDQFNRQGFVVGRFCGEGMEVSQGFSRHADTQARCALCILELIVKIEDLVVGESADIFKATLGEVLFLKGGVEAGAGGNQYKSGGSNEGPVAAEELGGAVDDGCRASLDGS